MKFMTGHNFLIRAFDRGCPHIIRAEHFPHRCPGVGCQIRAWLRREIARDNFEQLKPRA